MAAPGAGSRGTEPARGTSVPRTIPRSPRRSASILTSTGSLNIHSLPQSNRFEPFRGCGVLLLLLPSFGASSVMVIDTSGAFLGFFGEGDAFESDGYAASHRQAVESCCWKENRLLAL